MISLWMPYLGAGIKIEEISSDYRYIKVCLKQTWYNRNYVGTQFGGSLYAMTDPFYMLMLINNLGQDYYVWDKGATIDFVAPGKSKVTAEFRINDEIIEKVLKETASGEKYIFDLPVHVIDAKGELVASVLKKLYVRKKKKERT
ncbi:tetrameric acyl-CoA thioesterase [Bdellovibrio sp. ZAP7]|nr:tetrameric acyl-CoA thioesterase [Bdellovibrio sp. ZAP7]